MRFEFIEQTEPFVINILYKSLSNYFCDEIDDLWKFCQDQNSELINNDILYVDQINGAVITGYFSEYKLWYLQQHCNYKFGTQEKFIVAGVTGVVNCNDTLLTCKRAEFVTQDKNMYEFGPSGGITNGYLGDPNFITQLKYEFEEEMGLSAQHIASFNQLGLLMDHRDSVIDLIVEVVVGQDCKEFVKPTREYQNFFWFSLNDDIPKNLSPSSIEIYKFLKLRNTN